MNYQQLKPGDVIQQGDEWFQVWSDTWIPVYFSMLGITIQEQHLHSNEYRRPIMTEYHNPEDVPLDKIPEGWRLLTKEELVPSFSDPRYNNCRLWDDDRGEFFYGPNSPEPCDNGEWTYITDLPLPSKEPDYESKEYQAELRKKWAADPSIKRDRMDCTREWCQVLDTAHIWNTDHIYRETPPKPRTQSEIDSDLFKKWWSDNMIGEPFTSAEDAWHAACKYVRGEK